MNFKTTLILLIIFGVLLAAVLFMNKEQAKKEDIEEEAKKLLNLKKEDVTEVFLSQNDIHAVKQDDQWKIISPVETDGDKSAIEGILGMFNWAKIERTISEDTSKFTDYGLNPPRAEMILVHKDGRDTLYIGDKNPIGSFVFARKGNENRVFITSTTLKTNADKKLFDLRNKNVAKFATSDVDSFSLIYVDSIITCAKDTAGEWQVIEPEPGKAKSWKVSGITSAVSNLRVEKFVDDKPVSLRRYGLDKPVVVAKFYRDGVLLRELLVGNEKDENVYVKTADNKTVYLTKKNVLEKLTPKLDDLAEKKKVEKTKVDSKETD